MFKNFFKKLFLKISFIISPPYCEYCRVFLKKRDIFCQACYAKIKPIVSKTIQINSKYTMKIFAVSGYQEPLKSLILNKMKSKYLSSVQLGNILYEMTNIKDMNFDYLIPVPLHWVRYAKRGYNQTEVMSNVLSKKLKISVLNIIKRSKYTTFQSKLDLKSRIGNVYDAFKLIDTDLALYENKNLLIVDDLLTSGSTLVAVAKELIKLKPKSISVVVACRVI